MIVVSEDFGALVAHVRLEKQQTDSTTAGQEREKTSSPHVT